MLDCNPHVTLFMQMDKKANDKVVISATIAVFCLYYSILLLLPHSPLLQDQDTFWHIQVGQWILNHAQVPTADYFSYTAAGKPWISTEWLSEIFFALAFNLGEWRGVVVLTAIVCAAIVGLLCYYLLRNVRFSVAIGWTALMAVGISAHFLARPHVFSYVLLIIWTIKLLDAYDCDNFSLSSLLVFVPLMVLWSNLHGSFTFGLALMCSFTGISFCECILRRDYKQSWRILVITIVVILSALVTPYGISSALETARAVKMTVTNHHINEMRPPDFQNAHLMLLFFVGVLAAIMGLGVRLRGARLVAFCIVTAMALSYVRALAMFFLLTPIILARPVAACASYFAPNAGGKNFAEPDKEVDPVLHFLRRRIVALPAISLVLAALVTASVWARADIGPSKAIAPTAAIDFVRRANITGNVFNDYNFGGFLIFSGIPTFVDGRSLLYGDAFMNRYFAAASVADIGDAFRLLDEYKVSWTLLLPTDPLTQALARSSAWDKVYADKYSVVFTRHRS